MQCVFLVNKENNKRDWQTDSMAFSFVLFEFNYTLDSIVHFEEEGKFNSSPLREQKDRRDFSEEILYICRKREPFQDS